MLTTPFKKMLNWIEQEKLLGSLNPDSIVLATATKNGIPHSRIVAIREITTEGLLFFTQSEKRKAKEIKENPRASATLWLPLQGREVIIDGDIEVLAQAANENYWNTLPGERQILFSVYSSSSDQLIHSSKELDDKYKEIAEKFNNQPITMSRYYCGFRLVPQTFYFYTLGTNHAFSENIHYFLEEKEWRQQLLSP